MVRPNLGVFGGTGKRLEKATSYLWNNKTAQTIILTLENPFDTQKHTSEGEITTWTGTHWIFSIYWNNSSDHRGIYAMRYNDMIIHYLGEDDGSLNTFINSGVPGYIGFRYAQAGAGKSGSHHNAFVFITDVSNSEMESGMYNPTYNKTAAGGRETATQAYDGDHYGTLGTNTKIVLMGLDDGSGAASTFQTASCIKYTSMRVWNSVLTEAEQTAAVGGEGVARHIRWTSEAVSGFPQPAHEWIFNSIGTESSIRDIGSVGGFNFDVIGTPHFGRFTQYDGNP